MKRFSANFKTLTETNLHSFCERSSNPAHPKKAPTIQLKTGAVSVKCPKASVPATKSSNFARPFKTQAGSSNEASLSLMKNTLSRHLEPLPYKSIPGPRGFYQIPFLGTMFHFKPFTQYTAETAHKMLEELLEKYGPIVRMQLRAPTVLIYEPEDVEVLLQNEGRCPKRPSFKMVTAFNRRNNLKDSLADLQGEEWRSMRSLLNKHLMKVDSASYYMESQEIIAGDFVERLLKRELDQDELADLFYRYACESIGTVCFNTRLGLLADAAQMEPEAMKFLEATKEVFYLLNKEFTGSSVMHDVYRNKVYRMYEKTNSVIREFVKELVLRTHEEVRIQMEKGTLDSSQRNLLHALLTEGSLDFDAIYSILVMLFCAGTDSTANNLQSILYQLATNPEKQEIVYGEILNVVGKDERVTTEHISKSSYLKACLKETFRMAHPSLTGPVRFLPHDVVIRGYKIPAGVQVVPCSTLACQRLFEDPKSFLPERWLRDQGGRKQNQDVHPLSLIPFGFGPRICIGRRFAEQEIFLATIKILQKTKVRVAPRSSNTNFNYAIFVKPDKPIQFEFIQRDNV